MSKSKLIDLIEFVDKVKPCHLEAAVTSEAKHDDIGLSELILLALPSPSDTVH